MNIAELLKSMPDYIGSDGRTCDQIKEAERSVGIVFSEDYRNYLEEIGLACYDGHELTGITEDARLDVVAITKEKREQTGPEAAQWYVIEEACIDGIVIWQSSGGEVYQTEPGLESKKIADSLSDYICT